MSHPPVGGWFFLSYSLPDDVNLQRLSQQATMNKKAVLSLALAILMPVTGYLLVKYYSADAVHMPHRFFYDSVDVKEKNGKTVNDTIWHKVKNMSFTNQLGKKVSLDDLHGKVLVIDFFFTRCPSICPALAQKMNCTILSFFTKES